MADISVLRGQVRTELSEVYPNFVQRDFAA
jgi:hypothetical protein